MKTSKNNATKVAEKSSAKVVEPIVAKKASTKKVDEVKSSAFVASIESAVAKKKPAAETVVKTAKTSIKAAVNTPATKVVQAVKEAKKAAGPGIISTIVSLLEKAGKKGITRQSILTNLISLFPDRNPSSMENTIKVQLPGRINKERFAVKDLGNGIYCKA